MKTNKEKMIDWLEEIFSIVDDDNDIKESEDDKQD